MLANSNLILTAAPDQFDQVRRYGLPVGHVAYRIGGGPHLFRSSMALPVRGGLMVVDNVGFDGRGESGGVCREILRECAARNFSGVICDFEGRPLPVLSSVVRTLGELLHRQGMPLYVTESCAACSDMAKVLIPTALSGGSLRQRLQEAAAAYGPQRVALAVERVAEDFFLPSPTGQGTPLSREELKQRMEERAPTVFFSSELCARYFTYMSRENGAHFVLFDDAGTIRKKLRVARGLDIADAVLAYPQIDDLLPEILSGEGRGKTPGA